LILVINGVRVKIRILVTNNGLHEVFNLTQWKPGSGDEGVHRGKQVLALVADDEDRLFALSRRKVVVVDQDYFTAVRWNNLTVERVVLGFRDGTDSGSLRDRSVQR
jgi:hypothetical protein